VWLIALHVLLEAISGLCLQHGLMLNIAAYGLHVVYFCIQDSGRLIVL
jgi:hypothetical protein